ncbi:MAG: CAP domain-containing protein, partial [Gemmatimonadota bacterium]|nr:CAP domain-containing protein [Gemmatimonadota bacterium]
MYRTRRHTRFCITAALALLAACGDGLVGPEDPGRVEASPAVVEFAAQMNLHRQSEGCGELSWHDGVASVAQAHSQDMVTRGFFSHTNPDGDSPWDRLSEGGVTWSGAAGENIAAGTSDPTAVLNLWLASSGHRANIENCGFTHHGVGLVSGHWTHV